MTITLTVDEIGQRVDHAGFRVSIEHSDLTFELTWQPGIVRIDYSYVLGRRHANAAINRCVGATILLAYVGDPFPEALKDIGSTVAWPVINHNVFEVTKSLGLHAV